MANEPSKRSFQEYITGAKEGRITDGSLPDGRPQAQAVDTANRAVKEKLARDARDESPVERAVSRHPVGAAAGAVGGMAAGALAGIAAGPVGSLFGALAGAVLGGAMGGGATATTAGEPIDQPAWREHHGSLDGAAPYDQYQNAYRLGDAARRAYGRERRWEDLEPGMEADWHRFRGQSSLEWQDVRSAARSAWDGDETSGKVMNLS